MAVAPSRIRGLNVGITDIERWRKEDDVHLPPESRTAPAFLPETRPLDALLKRETLDERLTGYLVPTDLDPDLLAPAVMTETRRSVQARLSEAARTAPPGSSLYRAAHLLAEEVSLDDEVRRALAALLRG